MVQLKYNYITRSNSFIGARDLYINFFNLIQFFYFKTYTKPSKNRAYINNK